MIVLESWLHLYCLEPFLGGCMRVTPHTISIVTYDIISFRIIQAGISEILFFRVVAEWDSQSAVKIMVFIVIADAHDGWDV